MLSRVVYETAFVQKTITIKLIDSAVSLSLSFWTRLESGRLRAADLMMMIHYSFAAKRLPSSVIAIIKKRSSDDDDYVSRLNILSLSPALPNDSK